MDWWFYLTWVERWISIYKSFHFGYKRDTSNNVQKKIKLYSCNGHLIKTKNCSCCFCCTQHVWTALLFLVLLKRSGEKCMPYIYVSFRLEQNHIECGVKIKLWNCLILVECFVHDNRFYLSFCCKCSVNVLLYAVAHYSGDGPKTFRLI